MKLLHLDSSIQGDASASRAISAAIVQRLRSADSSLEVAYRDLAAEPLPHLSLDLINGAQAREVLAEFLAADIVVIGAAFYNFTIPSQLKAWIDRIAVKDATFRYGANGPEGLVGDKRVIVALARGGVYREGTPFASFEHAETLLRSIVGFMGITDPTFIIAEGVGISEEAREAAMSAALGEAQHVTPELLAA